MNYHVVILNYAGSIFFWMNGSVQHQGICVLVCSAPYGSTGRDTVRYILIVRSSEQYRLSLLFEDLQQLGWADSNICIMANLYNLIIIHYASKQLSSLC